MVAYIRIAFERQARACNEFYIWIIVNSGIQKPVGIGIRICRGVPGIKTVKLCRDNHLAQAGIVEDEMNLRDESEVDELIDDFIIEEESHS